MKDLIPKSGYYYPNRIVRYYLQALEETVGRNGLKALLNLIGMGQIAEEFPPSNLEKEFDFAEFSTLNRGILEVYGLQGGRNLSRRAGRAAFDLGVKGFIAFTPLRNDEFRAMPLLNKAWKGLTTLAMIFSQISDQLTSVEQTNGHILFEIDRCPVCWGQRSETPICFMAVGMVEESARLFSGGNEFRVEEICCVATGDDSCLIKIEEEASH